MESPPTNKARIRHPDRVSLSPESLARLSDWTKTVENRLKGSRITKAALVNFLILHHAPDLSERELEQLERDHFDEVRFAAWALRELKAARESGKPVTLAEILGRGDADGRPATNLSH